jgi:cytidine deaminase
MAAAAGDTDIQTIVAVNLEGVVVSPCGMCRELISDYSPCAQVIVPSTTEKAEAVTITSLLPNRFKK